jgi:hypothetical protein
MTETIEKPLGRRARLVGVTYELNFRVTLGNRHRQWVWRAYPPQVCVAVGDFDATHGSIPRGSAIEIVYSERALTHRKEPAS